MGQAALDSRSPRNTCLHLSSDLNLGTTKHVELLNYYKKFNEISKTFYTVSAYS